MAEQSKKITLYIFLFALFIALAFFVGTHMYNLYVSSRTISEETTKSSLQCAFSFQVSKINYEFPSLSFELRTSDLDLMKVIVIEVEDIRTEVVLGEFIDYKQAVNVDDIVIQDKFRVYPQGCKDYNLKECSLETHTCEILI